MHIIGGNQEHEYYVKLRVYFGGKFCLKNLDDSTFMFGTACVYNLPTPRLFHKFSTQIVGQSLL